MSSNGSHLGSSNGGSIGHANPSTSEFPLNSSTGTTNGLKVSTSSLSNSGNGHEVVKSAASNGNGSSSSSAFPPAETADYVGFRPVAEGSKIDRKEMVKLTIQNLRDLGYEHSARSLEAEAGVGLEHPSITAFRSAVLNGDWKNAERLLIDGLTYAASRKVPPTSPSKRGVIASGSSSRGGPTSTSVDLDSVLRDPVNRPIDSIKFLLLQQRFLELLEAGKTKKALSILRDKLQPLNHGSDRLHRLSSLVMCNDVEQLKERAEWSGSGLASRRKLLQEIELSVSPDVMVPGRRLTQLLEQAQAFQRQVDPYFNLARGNHASLYVDVRSDRSNFPTATSHVLRGHEDEVWCMAFSHDGKYLATGGKDKQVIIWSISPSQCEQVKVLGPHSNPVSCIAWSHDDESILTASDTEIYQWKWHTNEHDIYQEHNYQIFALAWLPGVGTGFVSGGQDGKVIFWDQDGRSTQVWETKPFRILGLEVTPDGRYLVAVSWRPADSGIKKPADEADDGIASVFYQTEALHSTSSNRSVGRSSHTDAHQSSTNTASSASWGSLPFLKSGEQRSKIHFWDLNKKAEVDSVYMREEIVSVATSKDSRYILINQRPGDAILWDIEERRLVASYSEHTLVKHMTRACFGGSEQSFVATGSEDAGIYIYHRHTGKLLDHLKGHGSGTVNAVAWHPIQHTLLASCSDDHTIRIWQPERKNKSGIVSYMTTDKGKVFLGRDGRPPGARDRKDVSSSSRKGRGNGGSATGGIRSSPSDDGTLAATGAIPFPWSMSPARASSPETGEGMSVDPQDPNDLLSRLAADSIAGYVARGGGRHAARSRGSGSGRMATSSSSGGGAGEAMSEDEQRDSDEVSEGDEDDEDDHVDEDDEEEDDDDEEEEEEEDSGEEHMDAE